MFGSRTAATVRTRLDDLGNVTDEARECLSDVKIAAQGVSRSATVIGIVAVAGLVLFAVGIMAALTLIDERV